MHAGIHRVNEVIVKREWVGGDGGFATLKILVKSEDEAIEITAFLEPNVQLLVNGRALWLVGGAQ